MDWVKLIHHGTDTPVYVNLAQAVSVSRAAAAGFSVIRFSGTQDEVLVREAPEQILANSLRHA